MRKSQYTTDRQFRIVSRPNNEWQLQQNKDGAHGSKTNDPWQNRSHCVSFDEAQALLRSHQPAQTKAG